MQPRKHQRITALFLALLLLTAALSACGPRKEALLVGRWLLDHEVKLDTGEEKFADVTDTLFFRFEADGTGEVGSGTVSYAIRWVLDEDMLTIQVEDHPEYLQYRIQELTLTDLIFDFDADGIRAYMIRHGAKN